MSTPSSPPATADLSVIQQRQPSSADKTFHQLQAETLEEDLYDTPKWQKEFSYRGSQYRYLGHQSNISGYVKIKLLEAKGLKRQDYSLLSPIGLGAGSEISSYMMFSVGCKSHSSSTVKSTNNPSWKKESFSIPLKKGEFPDGDPVTLLAKGMESQSLVETVLPTAVKGDKYLGTGGVDITSLCTGEKDIIDTWINLDPAGSVHVLIGYEAYGIEPDVNDIVCLEGFARKESMLILDPLSPMKVLDTNGTFLHVQYRMKSGRFGKVKILRSSVFVIERLNFLDGLWNLAMKPSDIVLGTKLGSKVNKMAKPYVEYAGELAKPAYYSAQLGIGVMRTSVNATINGASAATGTLIGKKSPTKL
ncbi:hypothetical protein TrLO_g11317 [Triparma laevis f. longispina]|uniref:C2 domain-containing protein n=1 Tax=Triparma laevis f. longispina TaxID=1714387 RepID=A0A9W7E013_9STRA|nr:hypothetical protein TrLO_g11317 [Triparma laevis f. longispina]